ncbi:MAG: hypothetical protein K0U59_11440, partial [Gammaproteobacteria bacterium]|nr:hypothetical protein [Gammaproteobacteria bacterium]
TPIIVPHQTLHQRHGRKRIKTFNCIINFIEAEHRPGLSFMTASLDKSISFGVSHLSVLVALGGGVSSKSDNHGVALFGLCFYLCFYFCFYCILP